MFEVIRWISIALMWIAVGMNLYAFTRGVRTWKRCERLEKQLEAENKYYTAMIAACTEFLEAAHKESEEAVNELG